MSFNRNVMLILTYIFSVLLFFAGVSRSEESFDPGQITFREPVQMQNEEIDPFTGRLKLTNTDLKLPGDVELSLPIVRTYNSDKTINQTPLNSMIGYGWDLHFGKLKKKSAIPILTTEAPA